MLARAEDTPTLGLTPAEGSEEPAVAGLEIGSTVAHVRTYEIQECIGEGGMGWVYRGFDPVLERDVAIKVMKPDVPVHEQRRFRQEAVYGARFCHPSVCRVYELVEDSADGSAWFAMEYLPGKDLERILSRALQRGRAIPMRLVADCFRQLLGALQYSHDCRIVHRDVKPANLFVTRDPNTRFVTAKLLDFGVALDLGKDRAPETHIVGDPRYMAPEQTEVNAAVDGRADIYAAGMSLYEVVTGVHPFERLIGGNNWELLAAHKAEVPIPLSTHLPNEFPGEVACGLDVVFERACAKDPDMRFESARDMQRALAEVFAI